MKTSLQWVLMLATLFGIRCASEPMASAPEPVRPVAMPILAEGTGNNHNLKRAGLYLIQSEDQLASMGLDELFSSARFDQQSLILLALGERPTGGYAATITGVTQVCDRIHVRGTAVSPGPDDAVTLAYTHPYAMAVVSKVTGTLVGEIESK